MAAENGYANLNQASPRNQNHEQYHGHHHHASMFIETVESAGLVRSESMEIHNDPRFFEGNVIDKRLSAFHIAGVVSVIMTKTAMSEIFGMKKDITNKTFDPTADNDGWAQILGFVTLSVVLWCNIVSVYVTIAQIYHTYRLMTAGQMGFEMATSYYLNRNIVFWRHLGIKCMLGSLPLLIMSTGLRLLVKFDRGMIRKPKWFHEARPTAVPLTTPHIGSISLIGLAVCIAYLMVSFGIYLVHRKHNEVYRERYSLCMISDDHMRGFLTHVETMSARGRFHSLDV